MRRTMRVAPAATAVVVLAAGVAAAHEGAVHDGDLRELRHALHDHQSDTEGHIAQDANYGLRPVGQDTLGGVSEGRYTDVWAHDGFAYVGTFEEPACDRSGVFVSDIRDPSAPRTVGMLESPPDTRVNDVKVVEVAGRDVLVHTLEACGRDAAHNQLGQGGISLWDVSDPSKPVALKQNFLDFGVHNTFPWTDSRTGRTYLVGVNDEEARDVFFVDISKPQSPRLLAEVGLPDWPDAQDEQSAGMASFAASFNHDVWVADVGSDEAPDYQAVVSYWDAGSVVLDVNDPAAPRFVDDSTYPDPDPITGFSPPEGNGHAAVFDAVDATRIFAGDEDFSPFRARFEILEGPNAGVHEAAEGAFTVPIATLPDRAMDGSTTYIGLACSDSDIPDAVEDGDPLTDEIAVIQRGACRFDAKASVAIANGYDGMIVFNDAARGDALVSMGGDSRDIPGVFVGHSTGLAIFDAASAGDLTIGQVGADTSTTAVFDGWGYFHLLDARTLAELGTYAPAQVNDPAFAVGAGDLTMHNVEGDPADGDVAFISWYSLGMRAVRTGTAAAVAPPTNDDGTADWDAATPGVDDYYGDGVTEVGRFIAPEGSNFWGVTVTEIGGQRYVLGSDRNTGLWLFTVDPTYCDAAEGLDCPQDATGGKGHAGGKRR